MKERLISWLAISERPDPPPGSGVSLSTFRASRRYLYYGVLAWVPKQVAAFIGLLFSLVFLGAFNQDFLRAEGWMRFMERLESLRFGILGVDANVRMLFTFFEGLAVLTFVAQLLFTGLLLKLSWELRWYMVGERALRIREGLWSLREQTMTIANIQTMIVRQGPVQRLFGISDLEIHTAGGGAGGSDEQESTDRKSALHIGRIRGIEDAAGLRDRLREQLIRHRGAGLGDDDERESDTGDVDDRDLIGATKDLLAAARSLRRAVLQAPEGESERAGEDA